MTGILIVGLFALAACQPTAPVRTFNPGGELATYNFEEARTFEEGLYANATLRIVDGVYRIELTRGDNELWWGQWGDTLSDVVVDVTVEQKSERNENAFGVACRMAGTVGQAGVVSPDMAAIIDSEAAEEAVTEVATAEVTEAPTEEATTEATAESTEAATAEVTETSTEEATAEATAEATEAATAEATEEFDEGAVSERPADGFVEIANGNGYLFLIQGNGSFAIMRAQGRDLRPLVNWSQTDKINQGQAVNQLRAVCVDDYLAFYINGEFVADATDDTFSAGQVGLLASAATRLGVLVEFDDLVVSQASGG